MKNNKGFSLVEILGIIVVLSILTIASFTVLDGVIKRNVEKTYKIQMNEILDGAISYTNSTRGVVIPNKLETSGCAEAKITSGTFSGSKENICKLTIDLQTLYDEGILDENLKNPKTKKSILGVSTVVITYLDYDGSNIKINDNQKINGRNLYTFNEVNDVQEANE